MKTKTIKIPDQEIIYYILFDYTKQPTIHSKPLKWLMLYELEDLNKYGYYLTKKEAEENILKEYNV